MVQGLSRPSKPRPVLSRTTTPAVDDVRPSATRAQVRPHGTKRHEDEPVVNYIKRTLCAADGRDAGLGPLASESLHRSIIASQPLESLLPPLTSSNAIDLQLYALIAVILDNFVHTWYGRITNDRQFTSEIVRIIAHCVQGVEERLQRLDLIAVLFDELPALIMEHIDAVRIAKNSLGGYGPLPTPSDVRTRYLALNPHVALSPVPSTETLERDQQSNEAAWALLLANRILPLLLPAGDLSNPCLDVLVTEIFADMVIRDGLCGKASEPWLLWEGVTKAITSSRRHKSHSTPAPSPQSAVENLIRGQPTTQATGFEARWHLVVFAFWSFVQAVTTAIQLFRTLTTTITQAATLPARTQYTPVMKEHLPNTDEANRRPIISMSMWTCGSRLLALEQRMPWLTGLLSLLHWFGISGPGRVCEYDSRLDRLLTSTLAKTLHRPATWLPSSLALVRTSLFPQNQPAPPRASIPTPSEAIELRAECARTIIDALPHAARRVIFATTDLRDMQRDLERDVLDLIGDKYLNKHLLVRIVDLLAVRLFPEIGREWL
ncbi:uncharacterized protein K489DRAFT_375916 [Dissoconium aciculare CBS 342.82]|uniref:PXA domain-containing protein n=1 Tax=Dissoconium aciculare CBS 342.82 TaxID=1314786 RepID=A0A6J3MIM1_9PEZI|nr:uncharacterized protein K489DRAFT_375916 [Dissoconium aciculare CBS 342.82]KAF1827771.1 hypothetical protein K489DRAFT_375916 [Dissoconium aciculare CBS 342.82]